MRIEGAKLIVALPKAEWTLNAVGETVIACAIGWRPRLIDGLRYLEPDVEKDK